MMKCETVICFICIHSKQCSKLKLNGILKNLTMPSWWLMSGDDGSSLCCHTVNFYLLTFAKYMLTIHSKWIRVATHLNCLIPKSLPVNFIKVNVIKMLNKSNIILLYVYVSYIYFSCCPQSLWKKHVQNLIL